MERKKIIVLGLGDFGHEWASEILPEGSAFAELAAIVDRNRDTWHWVPDSVPKFEDINEAVEKIHPDGVINVTPPSAHMAINMNLLGKGIPVLCEKPISETYEDACKLIRFARENGTCMMISENYRYYNAARKAREIISTLGNVHSAICHFKHFHPDASEFYHGKLAHPLIADVTVHHLDVARYLTGEEPIKVKCREWPAPYSWYGDRPASCAIHTEMTNGVKFDYDGTLASPATTTDWQAFWEVECDKGIVRMANDIVTLFRPDDVAEVIDCRDRHTDTRYYTLKEFVSAISEGRKGETDIEDNFKSFVWTNAAIESAVCGDEKTIADYLI